MDAKSRYGRASEFELGTAGAKVGSEGGERRGGGVVMRCPVVVRE